MSKEEILALPENTKKNIREVSLGTHAQGKIMEGQEIPDYATFLYFLGCTFRVKENEFGEPSVMFAEEYAAETISNCVIEWYDFE